MEKFKSKIINFVLFTLVFIISLSTVVKVNAVSQWDKDYFAYGAGLSQKQFVETQRLLKIPEDENLAEIVVSASDYTQFTGLAMEDSSLYSSVVVKKTKKGSGVRVFINTPDNITQIKDHQYINAALTSGVQDCDIIVGSPIPVTGESALIGVYMAFKDAGFEIDEDATKIATDELIMVNDISQDNKENPDFDSENFSLAIAEIKKKISEITDKSDITIGELNIIVTDALNRYDITISDADKAKLISWLDEFKELDIDWKAIGKELSGLGNFISKKAGEVYKWGQETGFFSKLWSAIKDFINNLFN